MPSFDPTQIQRFRFTERSLSPDGLVTLRYALDDAEHLVETFQLPLEPGVVADEAAVSGILDLLHWVAGVSYYKLAAPPQVSLEAGIPGPAAAAYLEALYSEGLGEFAYENRDRLPNLPRPTFPRGAGSAAPAAPRAAPTRALVPIGGGKDSIVALEIVRRSGLDFSLFAVNALDPMRRTAEVAGVPVVAVKRTMPLDDFTRLNSSGALNGHVPITAIISCVALLTAKLGGYDAVTLANERSASVGNLVHDGVEVNHQFSKSARAEALLRAAAAEALSGVDIFSILRPAPELAIARAFATKTTAYHHAFTSCNRNFRTDPSLRGGEAWCRDCPKCRFVFLMLAPFLSPEEMEDIFGGALLDDDAQFEGFALLTATGGHKPFECVGEEEESLAAIELLDARPEWREQRVVKRLVAEALEPAGRSAARIEQFLTLSAEHHVPPSLIDDVRAFL